MRGWGWAHSHTTPHTGGWDGRNQPAISTYLYMNYAVRTERWRYIRYADGSEELYDEAADPYGTNLAGNPAFAPPRKAELSKFLPERNLRDIGGS